MFKRPKNDGLTLPQTSYALTFNSTRHTVSANDYFSMATFRHVNIKSDDDDAPAKGWH